MPTADQVRDSLAEVQDPELHMGIIDLGLIYDVTCEGENGQNVTVVMTLTSPMCPVGPMFKQSVHEKAASVYGVETVNVEITFTPPWDPRTMANDDVKLQLGIW